MVTAILIIHFVLKKTKNQPCQHTFRISFRNTISSNSLPQFIAIADFNKDSLLDIVVANSGTSSIGVFLAYDYGYFREQIIYQLAAGSRPSCLAVSDFNNDTILDIVVGNYGSNSIAVFLGHDDGNFSYSNTFSIGSSRPVSITTGDFNGDRLVDIAIVSNATTSLLILLGHRNAMFTVFERCFTGYDSLPHSVTVGDFDSNGKLDIVTANAGTSTVAIFLGYGNGSFAHGKFYSTGYRSSPQSVTVADMNDDHQLDIVVANNEIDSIGILFGYGNGTFDRVQKHLIEIEAHPTWVAVADCNDDDILDLVVASEMKNKVYILLGQDKGATFMTTSFLSDSANIPYALAIADFNKDNVSDVAVANYLSNKIQVLVGYSRKTSVYETHYRMSSEASIYFLAVADLNKDNQLDICVADAGTNSIITLFGSEDGMFTKASTGYSTGGSIAQGIIRVSDLNNDSRLDIIVTNGIGDSIGVLFGFEDGSFQSVKTFSTGTDSYPRGFAVGDLNNDKQCDIITANSQTDNIGIFLANDQQSFGTVTLFSTGQSSQPYQVAAGDLNLDGSLDVVVSNHGSDTIGIFFGDGTGNVGAMTTYSTGSGSAPRDLVLADLNKDNYLDIAVASTEINSASIFLGDGKGSFGDRADYRQPASFRPHTIGIVDINGDVVLDIVLPNFGTGSMEIFLGYGNGTFYFAIAFVISVDAVPYGFGFGDFNNDNTVDIAVVGSGTKEIIILFQYEGAEFTTVNRYLTGSSVHPYAIAAGDLNSDGIPDLVVADSVTDDLQLIFPYNNGESLRKETYFITAGARPYAVVVGDLNNDHWLDIAVANSNLDFISVLLGRGDGTIAKHIMYPTDTKSNPRSLAIADFNNDNRSDIVVASESRDVVGVLLGFNYVAFQNQTIYSLNNSSFPFSVVTFDFNKDGYLDIAYTDGGNALMAILFGYGNGTFSSATTYSTGINSDPHELVVADFNNDSFLDIAVANFGSGTFGIFLGASNGSFEDMTSYSISSDFLPFAISCGDFNKDGWPDLVLVSNKANSMYIYLGYGNGSFYLIQRFSEDPLYGPLSVAIYDLNMDSQLDLVVANYKSSTVGVFLGYGNGSFQNSINYATDTVSGPKYVAVNDFDKDAMPDIAVAYYQLDSIGILYGYGNGTFKPVVIHSSGDGSHPLFMKTCDLNNDNQLDIVMANFGSSTVAVLYGSKNNDFLLGSAYVTGMTSSPNSVALGDFNGDNYLDIAVANLNGHNVAILLQNSTQPFGSFRKFSTGITSAPYAVTTGDVNNDSFPDILVSNYGTDCVGILQGYGDGNFGKMTVYPTGNGSQPSGIAVADLNNDTRLDIVVTNSGKNNIGILFGYGNGTFRGMIYYSTGDDSIPYAVVVGDLNNDNIFDIVVANSRASNIAIFNGYGNGTFVLDAFYPIDYQSHPLAIVLFNLNMDAFKDIGIACEHEDNVEILMGTC